MSAAAPGADADPLSADELHCIRAGCGSLVLVVDARDANGNLV